MKKLMIMHHSGSIGGAGISIYNTIRALSDEYQVLVYCPSSPSDFSDFLRERNIEVKTYDFPLGGLHYYSGGFPIYHPGFLKSIVNIFRYKSKWNQILESERPDILIANSKILSWVGALFKDKGFKTICYVRETRKEGLLNIINRIQGAMLDRFTGVIFISEYDQKMESLKKAKTKVVPNFIDIDSYKSDKNRVQICEQLGIDPEKFNVLYVGGMLKIKGYDVAVKSIKYLKDIDINLIVAGYSEFYYRPENNIYSKLYNRLKKKYENDINSEIESNNLGEIIKKIGIQKNMSEIYSIADVLIFPATKPHQARPVFEAGAMKVPVIMPDFENTLEYVGDGENGLIFKREDPRSLASSISLLAKDEDYRRRLGESNYSHTLKKHTREGSEKLIKEIVESVLED